MLYDVTQRCWCFLTGMWSMSRPPLAVLAILMGVFPGLFLDKVKPSIEHLAANYKHYRLIVNNPAPISPIAIKGIGPAASKNGETL